MELAPSTEPWTAAVAWARPWRRPAARRPSVTASRALRPPGVSGPVVSPSVPAQENDWLEALAEWRAAREALVQLDAATDTWLEALARQDMFRARRKLRRAQEALTGTDADLPWSSC